LDRVLSADGDTCKPDRPFATYFGVPIRISGRSPPDGTGGSRAASPSPASQRSRFLVSTGGVMWRGRPQHHSIVLEYDTMEKILRRTSEFVRILGACARNVSFERSDALLTMWLVATAPGLFLLPLARSFALGGAIQRYATIPRPGLTDRPARIRGSVEMIDEVPH